VRGVCGVARGVVHLVRRARCAVMELVVVVHLMRYGVPIPWDGSEHED